MGLRAKIRTAMFQTSDVDEAEADRPSCERPRARATDVKADRNTQDYVMNSPAMRKARVTIAAAPRPTIKAEATPCAAERNCGGIARQSGLARLYR